MRWAPIVGMLAALFSMNCAPSQCDLDREAAAGNLDLLRETDSSPVVMTAGSLSTFHISEPFTINSVELDEAGVASFAIVEAGDDRVILHATNPGAGALTVHSQSDTCSINIDTLETEGHFPNTSIFQVIAHQPDRVIAEPLCDAGLDIVPPYVVTVGSEAMVRAYPFYQDVPLIGTIDDPTLLMSGPGEPYACADGTCISTRPEAPGMLEYYSNIDDSLIAEVVVVDPDDLTIGGLVGPATFDFKRYGMRGAEELDRLKLSVSMSVDDHALCRVNLPPMTLRATAETLDVCRVLSGNSELGSVVLSGQTVDLRALKTGNCRVSLLHIPSGSTTTYEVEMRNLLD